MPGVISFPSCNMQARPARGKSHLQILVGHSSNVFLGTLFTRYCGLRDAGIARILYAVVVSHGHRKNLDRLFPRQLACYLRAQVLDRRNRKYSRGRIHRDEQAQFDLGNYRDSAVFQTLGLGR